MQQQETLITYSNYYLHASEYKVHQRYQRYVIQLCFKLHLGVKLAVQTSYFDACSNLHLESIGINKSSLTCLLKST